MNDLKKEIERLETINAQLLAAAESVRVAMYVNDSGDWALKRGYGAVYKMDAAIEAAKRSRHGHAPAPVAQSAGEPVAMLWQVRRALALASAICDAVPNRNDGHLGKLVNAQPDGTHGYRLIHDAEAALVTYLTTPEAAPPAEALRC